MKNTITRIFGALLTAAVLLLTAACSENTIYVENSTPGGGEVPTLGSTEVKGHFALGGKKVTSVASAETFKGSSVPADGNFTAKVYTTSSPQIIMGANASGDITFLYRGYANESDDIEVNEYTTATALLTLHPAFWCLSADDYGTLETKVKSLAGYDNLVSEVRKVLESGKSILDGANTGITETMKTCYEQLGKLYTVKGGVKVSSSTSHPLRNFDESTGNYDYYPIEFSPEYDAMRIRVVGLAPPYECKKIVGGEVAEKGMILGNTAYGLSDLGTFAYNGWRIGDYKEAYRDVNRGEWVEFGMSEPDDYNFVLDRTTPLARDAQKCFFVSDVLNMVGLLSYIKVDKDQVTLASELLDKDNLKLLEDMVDILKPVYDPNNFSDTEWLKSYYYSVCNILYRHLSENSNSVIQNMPFLKAASDFFSFYDNFSAVVSIMGRTYMNAKMPDKIAQCFSQHHNVITTCNGTGISIRSGNNQVVESARKLDEPIVFSVICNLGQRVKVEVTKGNGTLSEYYLTPKVFDGTTQYVSTEWTLGDKTGEQTLTAYIVDTATDQKQSPECVVSACISKGNLLTSIGDAFRFTYDEQGRMATVTDRTCMLVEPDPSEIVTSRFEYKDKTGKELSRIVSTGDGETDIWYDIKYNSDGNIQTFRWSATDEYGTEYGAGRFFYEPDGRIFRIFSYADDGQTSLTFTWKGGLLQSISYDDPDATGEEVGSESYTITYGDQKNLHEQYPSALVMLELGSLFFSGQVGPGPSYLPNSISGPDMSMRLSYVLRNDGYIARESMRFGDNQQYGYRFDYSYKEGHTANYAPLMSSPSTLKPKSCQKMRRHLRILGLRR